MGVGLVLAVAAMITGVVASRQPVSPYADRGVPVLELSGLNWEEFAEGEKSTRYYDNVLTVYDRGEVAEYTGVEIKGRGNLTWLQLKKPMQIKFARATEFLGLGKAKTWVLLTNYLDPSYLRSDVAFKLAEMVGVKYANRGEFVEVYVDEAYQGLYYLLKKNVVSKNAVDLRDAAGVLVELDNLHRDGESCYGTYGGNCLTLKDAVSEKDKELTNQAMAGFVADFNRLEMAAEKGDYAAITEVVDVESLAKYFIVSEFTVNPDAYSSSFYWHKDGAEDKIHAGPVWDFDLALGNRNWVWARTEKFYSPLETMVRRPEVITEGDLAEDTGTAKLMYHLMEIPEFRAEVERIWQERVQGREKELLLEIYREANLIRAAALADGEYWETGDFEVELQNLLEWVKLRYEYFEKNYGNRDFTAKSVI